MKKQKMMPHAISGVFVFLLLGVFAVFSTVTVLLSAGAYRSISERSGVDSTARLASAYVRSMLRSRDERGALQVAEESGLTTLTLRSVYGDEEFRTRIYVYDGTLRELFTEADAVFEPKNGEAVCAAEAMEAELTDGLLRVRLMVDGAWQEIDVAPCAAAEGGTP